MNTDTPFNGGGAINRWRGVTTIGVQARGLQTPVSAKAIIFSGKSLIFPAEVCFPVKNVNPTFVLSF